MKTRQLRLLGSMIWIAGTLIAVHIAGYSAAAVVGALASALVGGTLIGIANQREPK